MYAQQPQTQVMYSQAPVGGVAYAPQPVQMTYATQPQMVPRVVFSYFITELNIC